MTEIHNRDTLARTRRHECALDAIVAGIEAAHPRTVISTSIAVDGETLVVGDSRYRLADVDDLVVLGGGKPAGLIAAELEEILGDRIDGGVVVTETPAETSRIDVVQGTHPLPSAQNLAGTERVLARASELTADDLALVVLGGGGSALLTAPATDLSLESYRSLTEELLQSGATIDEINAVRKHLSRIKGGQLARTLTPATAVGILFSDVVDNRLDVIASGPTAPDPTTYQDARAVLARYDIPTPAVVESILAAGSSGSRPETPDAESAVFEYVRNHVLADNWTALDAASDICEAAGYEPVVLSAQIEGEAREVGRVLVGIAASCLDAGEPFEPPVALLSGGETTVTVRGDGDGGPNLECALSAARDLAARDRDMLVASVDTDGIDGTSEMAGAIVDGTTVDATDSVTAVLDRSDSAGYLGQRETAIRTGSTGTNVNDLRIVLVNEA